MIMINSSKRDNVSPKDKQKVLSIHNPHYTQQLHDPSIDEKKFSILSLYLMVYPTTTAHIVNHWLIGVVLGVLFGEDVNIINAYS